MVFVKPKFALGSWTILGGLGMLLTILAPYISAYLGIDITPEDIMQGSEVIDGAVKSVTGAFFFLMLVWGRIKAGKKAQPITLNPLGADPVLVETPKKNFNLD